MSRLHVAIDARALTWTGIGRYIRNLLASLAAMPGGPRYTVLLRPEDSNYFKQLFPRHPFALHLVEASYYSWREQLLLPRQLQRVTADVWHFTHFNVPLLFRRPYVVTIHDTTRFIFPGQQRQGLVQQAAYERVFAAAVARARGVICVSESTRQELRRLPITVRGTLRVIHEGIETDFLAAPSAALRQKVRLLVGTRDPYLLFVGVWMSHKNLQRMLEAYVELQRRYPTLKLVLTGRPKPGYVDVVGLARQLSVTPQVIWAGHVPDALLPALYREAACFFFPSLYEGFGLPPLEALACGTPVVASNTSSLPEILGSHVEYVNPEYVPDMVRGVTRVLEGSADSAAARARRQAHCRQFRWDAAAAAHRAMYEQSASR